MTTIQQLYNTLHERRRPEDVAQMVTDLTQNNLTTKEKKVLDKAAAGSLARNVHGYTSMLQTFAEAIGAGKQIAKAIELFKLNVTGKPNGNNIEEIEQFIALVSPIINKPVGQNNFKTDRLNKEQRFEMDSRSRNAKYRGI